MQPIPINRTKEDLARQAAFLIRLSNHAQWHEHKRALLYLLGFTMLLVFCFVFTGSNQLIALKGVASVLMTIFWIIAIVYALFFFSKRYRAHQAMRSVFENSLQQPIKEYLSFNEDNITISSSEFSSELKWSYYTNYLEDDSTLYLFKAGTPYTVVCFSVVEIGEEPLLVLKQIARNKLEKLTEPLHLV